MLKIIDKDYMASSDFEERLMKYREIFHPVVPFHSGDKLLLLNFTEKNKELTPGIINDTNTFSQYINTKLAAATAKYGIGGYNEHRSIYTRSSIFNDAKNVSAPEETAEPRRLHLGIDIWGKPYTRVMAPIDGIVHSFAFNSAFGDYGATIILSHRLEDLSFYTLYGHLSLGSIKNLSGGERIKKGDVFAEFGIPQENGSWPPHLHFQLIKDMQGHKGDYPGVCKYSEREQYLANCPDPDLILGMMPYAIAQF